MPVSSQPRDVSDSTCTVQELQARTITSGSLWNVGGMNSGSQTCSANIIFHWPIFPAFLVILFCLYRPFLKKEWYILYILFLYICDIIYVYEYVWVSPSSSPSLPVPILTLTWTSHIQCSIFHIVCVVLLFTPDIIYNHYIYITIYM